MESERDTAWGQLLDGELAARAEDVVTEIADALAGISAVSPTSLAGGGPGIGLFFAYLASVRPGQGHEERAGRLLDAGFDGVAAALLDSSLFVGFSGVAWTAEHVLGGADDDPSASIDEALRELLAASPWRGDYDLVTGLVGLAVYALERMPRPSARECLELILDRMVEMAERRDGRATWRTPPELLIEPTRSEHPDGHYNLGVAHGVPAAVTVLAGMAAAGVGGERARELLREATAWVLDQRLDSPEGRSLFPIAVGPGIAPAPARFAWCYGDPGVAAALLAAARAAGDEALHDVALQIARRAAAQPASRADVVDAALCHGAAGVAHLFNRIHQSTGDAACADASRRWFARTLEMRSPGQGVAGFRYPPRRDAPDAERVDEPGFLTGAAGIGLAILAATSTVEPAWDRLLLASLPP